MVNVHSTPSTSTSTDAAAVAAAAIMTMTRANNKSNGTEKTLSSEHTPSSANSFGVTSPEAIELTGVQQLLLQNRTVVAASCAAVTSVFCGFPFDSVKTRMQTHNYRSLSDCVRKTYRVEGVRGFFRGIVPPLLTVSVLRATSFSVYERSKAKLRDLYGRPENIFNLGAIAFIAGGTSGAAIAALSCPFELVKIQRQLQVLVWEQRVKELRRTLMDPQASAEARLAAQHAQQRLIDPRTQPTWASVKEIVRLRGPSVRDLAGTGTYFAGYECIKRTLSAIEGDGRTSSGVHFLAGGLAGVFCWLLTFPLDLVKSLIQKDVTAVAVIGSGPGGPIATASKASASTMSGHRNTGFTHKTPSGWRVARDIVQRSGFRGLYTGISVTLIRAFPIHALNFTVYEYVTERIQEFAHPIDTVTSPDTE
ncbi:mitochondrial carrier domain-containing protein [Syncephalis fuscata]|nr:mitochondrial carrier domain-containing protein [Syncephalis fuscata]